MAAYWIGETVSGHACATICGNSLANEDRATGMTICETVAAGLMGMVGPILGATLVTNFGGVNTQGIRPLFFVAFVGTLTSLYLIYKKMSNHSWIKIDRSRPNFFRDIFYVLKQGSHLKRWLVVVSIGSLPMGMVFPFTQVYAHEFKGADEYVMGLMVTGFALTSFLMGVPMGRLADKIGRKKVLYLTLPLFWSSNILLIWAPANGFLIGAGMLQGFFFICATIMGAMSFEMVPSHQMGRWIGLMRLCRLILSSITAFLAGVIWDTVGPEFVFLTVMGLDIFVRLPLLIGMPETLDLEKRK
jgi:MFS family permease